MDFQAWEKWESAYRVSETELAPDVTSAEEEHYMNTQEEITLDLVQAGAQYVSFCLLRSS